METNRPADALALHRDASRIAQLIEDLGVGAAAPREEVQALARAIPESSANRPRGISAYVIFDNIMKCRVRTLDIPSADEIETEAIQWRLGKIAYSEPEHFARFGTLLTFGYAFAGRLGAADELIRALESGEGKPQRVHLETWRVLLTLLGKALIADPGIAPRRLWPPTEWIVRRTAERQEQSRSEAALIFLSASDILRRVASDQHGLTSLSRAIELFPRNIHLRAQRAVVLLAVGKRHPARMDCDEAVAIQATDTDASKPFHQSEGHKDSLYAQGIALWLLGREKEAEDRFRLSQYAANAHYRRVLPSALGAAR